MDKEFEKYVVNSREEFITKINNFTLVTEERILIENLLACFDEMFKRLKQPNISSISILSKDSLDKENVKDWIDEYRKLWPEGKNDFGYPYKGDKTGLIKKLITFFNKYPEYTKEDVFKATKEHIKKYKGNYQYLQQSHYFISKDGISTLASICEFNKTTKGYYQKEDSNLGSTESV